MTELVELIKKRKEAMYDGIVEQWHEHMDRAYEAQSESLKRQMEAAEKERRNGVLEQWDGPPPCRIARLWRRP